MNWDLLLSVVTAGGMAVLPVVVLVHQWKFRTALGQAWRRAAESVGLSLAGEAASGFSRSRAEARGGGLAVSFEYEVRSKRAGTCIRVSGLGHGAPGLTIRREGFSGWISKKLGHQEVVLGAAADAELLIEGDEVLAQALLDLDTREKVAAFLRGQLEGGGPASGEVSTSLADGVLEIWVRHTRLSHAEGLTAELRTVLTPLLDLARRLSRPADLAERLAGRLLPGPGRELEEEARRKCLHLLLRDFSRHPATVAAVSAALGDSSEWVRFEAARSLGAEGVTTLRALVEAPGTDDACAARALRSLGNVLPPKVRVATVTRALAAARAQAVQDRTELLQAGLETLAQYHPQHAEAPAMAALAAHNEHVVATAARVLGRVGTVTAVPALREAEAQGPRTVAAAARQAVSEIQARLEGAEAGQLSVAGGEAGALTLTEEREAGRVSLVSEEEPETVPTAGRGARAEEE